MNALMFEVYILECSDRSLYCDITNELKSIISLHRASGHGYTRRKTERPVRLIPSWSFDCRDLAIAERYCFRNKSRADKIMYISKPLLD